MKHAVVVTGIGLISPLGNQPEVVFDSLMQGQSGVRLLSSEQSNGVATAAGVVDFSPEPWFTRLQLSGVDRVSQMGVAAADLALKDAGLAGEALMDAGIYIGCGMGGASAIETAYTSHFSAKPRVSPLSVVASMTNAPAAHIAMRFGIGGRVMTYSIACASSSVAIGEGYRAIASGETDIVIAGGCEALLVPCVIRAWQAMQTLAMPSAEQPETACRPFSLDRSGLVLGEGAAMLILEREDHALARGVKIYARVSGFGMSCDATHITRPEPTGQTRALHTALRNADLRPADIGYCNAHGTATQVGDPAECAALREVWGKDADNLLVSSTKSMHGHLLGAAGALEAAVTVLAVHHKQLPPTAHCNDPDPVCNIPLVRSTGIASPHVKAAISNSFAFGGTNAVLVFTAA
ncbi:beta-ketoacyl-[acyl-carrier-protein] synthase family protein [Chitinimonas sp. BJB300]|uniref:beta-ketoacyl-[acyl-carrier-protein] synthase family protein n=1 Tax=Chitinimonas sp. BJB300 TaxID=1559339 RepID=UPI000C0FC985|nr:beta-ketoacyl-[acyl-carrier-protein] synthase family protein [Chitinimonas sp. BJB300]PHV12925.1 beta-ketoacyl synthase [Chitinimonas sp. BJB300]TSJ88494.1 beta-ketoacyl-[acyl-carrier-protein] synthase family protein [Chitinimonas sp. BJB300]